MNAISIYSYVLHALLLIANGGVAGIAIGRVFHRNLPAVFRLGSLVVTAYALTAVIGSFTLIATPPTIRTYVLLVATIPAVYYAIYIIRHDSPGEGL